MTSVDQQGSRAEHLRWSKERALEYADKGDTANTLASLTSDLSKHEDTAGHAGIMLGTMLAMSGHLSTSKELRDWVEGLQ